MHAYNLYYNKNYYIYYCTKHKIHLDSLPSSVEKPEWIVKATLVRKMLECEKRSIAEP